MRHAGQPGRNTQELRKPFIRTSCMASPSGEKNVSLRCEFVPFLHVSDWCLQLRERSDVQKRAHRLG